MAAVSGLQYSKHKSVYGKKSARGYNTTNITSFSGDVQINNGQVSLLPAASGTLNLLAAGSLITEKNAAPSVLMYESDPARVPSVLLPFNPPIEDTISTTPSRRCAISGMTI